MLAARSLRTLGARSLAARGTQSRLAALKKPQRHLALAHKTEIDDERMPTTYADYSNHVLLMLSAHGDDQAIRERMVRDVMKVDGVEHTEAEKTVGEIEQAAKSGLAMSRLPYRVGIAAALVAGFGSIPMCFDLHTVLWFNEQYVTMDVEDAKNLETWLEVGSWSWNWMEPPLGTISFFILCIQFAREKRLEPDEQRTTSCRPYAEALFASRGWQLPDALTRVYDSSAAVRELCWTPRVTFDAVLQAMQQAPSSDGDCVVFLALQLRQLKTNLSEKQRQRYAFPQTTLSLAIGHRTPRQWNMCSVSKPQSWTRSTIDPSHARL